MNKRLLLTTSDSKKSFYLDIKNIKSFRYSDQDEIELTLLGGKTLKVLDEYKIVPMSITVKHRKLSDLRK